MTGVAPAMKDRMISRASLRACCIRVKAVALAQFVCGVEAGSVPLQTLNLVCRVVNSVAALAALSRGNPMASSNKPSARVVGATGFGIDAVCGGQSDTRNGACAARRFVTVTP